MVKTVSAEGLEAAISHAVKEYTDAVSAAIVKEVDETSKRALADIKRDSPVRTGAYEKGWVRRKLGEGSFRVYNKDKGSLTHLLEKGHAKRGGGRVEGKPHIGPAVDKHVVTMPKRIERIIKGGG